MEFPVILIGGIEQLRWPGIAAGAAWIFGLGGLVLLVWLVRSLEAPWTLRGFALLIGLASVSAAAVLFTGIRFRLPDPMILPDEIGRQEDVFFIALLAVPLFLAAGFSGPVMGGLTGFVAGSTLALFSSGNPFHALTFGALGVLAAVFLRQRYRTPFYTLFRRPLAAAFALAALYPLLYLAAVLLGFGDEILVRLNFGFGLVIPETLAGGASLLIAGLAGGAAARLLPEGWGSRKPLAPSPAEVSLETRSFLLMGIFFAAAVIALSALGWAAAYRSASGLVRSRMAGSAGLAAQSLPNALETGQGLIQIYLSDPLLNNPDGAIAESALEEKLSSGVYFSELLLVGADGSVIAKSTAGDGSETGLSPVETSGVALAGEGVPFQYYASEVEAAGSPSIVSFIAPVPGGSRVLVGRSLLTENPFIMPLLVSMQNLGDIDGTGILVDERGSILHHPMPAMVNSDYAGAVGAEPGFSTSATPDGRPALVYSVPVEGRSWRILMEVPIAAIQRIALGIALPFVGLLIGLAGTSLVTSGLILRLVTGSLRGLAQQATEIAETRSGIGSPIDVTGVDEVGRMRAAFERMRSSLKARMDEQARLLEAGQGAASSLDFSQAVKPVLRAALATGADSVRVVLSSVRQDDLPAAEPRSFGAGPSTGRFAYLDDQVLRLLQNEESFISRNPVSHTGLSFGDGNAIPAAMAAVGLRHDRDYLGVIWLGYSGRRNVSEEEVRFLSGLAAQASLAVANTRLFRSAQIGRERLAAILASTPDPIIVTDPDGRLVLANLAAIQVLGDRLEGGEGRPIEELLAGQELAAWIRSDPDDNALLEVQPASGGFYVARLKAFVFRGESLGKVCILRDVTRYKELDTVKDELVQNVGHDLEQPLTLILGYVTMLSLVGDVNAEQMDYVGRIANGVERMKRMVQNLVHMGKIEAGVGLEIVELSLVDLAIRIVQEQQPQALQKNVKIGIARPAGPIPSIVGDENLLVRSIGNLVDNAIKYTDEGGTVLVSFSVGQNGRVVRLSVKDDGIGIALPDQERLFERFFRGNSPEKKKRHGTGLGLAIVKSVIESHGGRVWAESSPGAGSTFHVELPAA